MEEKIPRYEQIRRELTEQIRLGKYAPGAQLPSEKELTSLYGVSRITISKALSLLRDEGYISRVQGKGTYAAPPEDWNRAVPSGGESAGPRKIGVLIPMLVDLHGLEIIRAVTDTLQLPDYLVMTVVVRSQESEDYTLRWFREQKFDGLIIFPMDSELYNETILSMQLERFPFVLIDRYFPGINASYVAADNRLGAERAVEHLLSLGHERIAFVASSPMSEQATAARYEGYCDALRKNGILPRDCVQLIKSPAERERFGRAIAAGRITAVLASNAYMAVQTNQLCAAAGRRVPEDFSIVSFDSASLLPEEDGFFTHVNQHSYRMGAAAAEILLRLLRRSREEAGAEQEILEPVLVPGRSTARSVPGLPSRRSPRKAAGEIEKK